MAVLKVSKMLFSWRKFLAMAIPLTVSLMAELTSAMACMPLFVTLPGQAAEAERQAKNEGEEGKEQQGQVPFGLDDDDTKQDGLENLGGYIGDDDDQVAEVVGIGIDAGGNAPGGELVVKGQVVFDGGTEGEGAQVEDDIAHDADR